MTWDIQKLFKLHAREIASYLRRRGMDEQTAADLTQDAFVRVLTSSPSDDRAAHNPAAYLFRVARNLRIDHLRREGLLVLADPTVVDLAAIVDPAASPERIVYGRQRLALTRAALAELPERSRRAFEMHRVEDMTIAAIAAELGLSVSRTWTLIRDAYEHIDARLTGL